MERTKYKAKNPGFPSAVSNLGSFWQACFGTLTASELCTKAGRSLGSLYCASRTQLGPCTWLQESHRAPRCVSVGQVNYPKVADSSSFDEDSSDALSPEQPASHESQGSVPSPLEPRVNEPLPSATSTSPTQVSSPLLRLPRVRPLSWARWAVPTMPEG